VGGAVVGSDDGGRGTRPLCSAYFDEEDHTFLTKLQFGFMLKQASKQAGKHGSTFGVDVPRAH
jgi:hypothetical protein